MEDKIIFCVNEMQVERYRRKVKETNAEAKMDKTDLEYDIKIIEWVRLGGGSGIIPVGIYSPYKDLYEDVTRLLRQHDYHVHRADANPEEQLSVCSIVYHHKYLFGLQILKDKEGTLKQSDPEQIRNLIQSAFPNAVVVLEQVGYLGE